MKAAAVLAVVVSLAAGSVTADVPKVISVRAERSGGMWTIEVTLSHADTGWDHYASGVEIQAPDGKRIGYRDITHPHVGEQTFKRALSGLRIPSDIAYVLIRTRCSLVGWSADPVRFDLPR